jgi:non-ribosomal peptide synthetase component F
MSRNPLFQVALAMQNTPQAELRLAGARCAAGDRLSNESAKFDLQFSITEIGGMLRTRVEYATDLFDAGTIERMIGHWRVLLAGIVADPAQPISRLPLLTPQERHQLVEQWNATAVEYLASAVCTSSSNSKPSARRRRWRLRSAKSG